MRSAGMAKLAVWAASAWFLAVGAQAQTQAPTQAPRAARAEQAKPASPQPKTGAAAGGASRTRGTPATGAASAGATVQDAKTGFQYSFGPAPAWVLPPPAAAPAPPGPAAPMHYQYIDEQIRVEGSSSAEYRRQVRVVNDSTGLDQASQIEIEFDPTYQSLVIHALELVRGAQRIDKRDRQRMQLLQREKGLEQRLYDGRATLSVVLDDVRAGDQIELAYTVSGSNPVFEGRFVHSTWLSAQRGPIAQFRVRLLAPVGRTIQHRGPAGLRVDSSEKGGWRETFFNRDAVPVFRFEPGTPPSELVAEQLLFSEFADWAGVAQWGDRLFAPRGANVQAAAKSAEIAAAHATPQARLLEALRFVQQEVRYFGTEIGANSHQPAAPDLVLSRRYGDCKDKVALLAALLAPMGIQAQPVLVSTRLRAQVQHALPSPLAFDHVIAKVQLDGRTYWLDGTRSRQLGELAARQSLGLGLGLVLGGGNAALDRLPDAQSEERMRVSDLFRVDSFGAPARLSSRISYRGELAEIMREVIATQGLEAVAPTMEGPYLKAYPKIRRTAAARLDNDPTDNMLSIVQDFEVPDMWRFPEERLLVADLIQWGPVDWVMPPKIEARRYALGFGQTGRFRHQVRMEFGEDVFPQPSSREAKDGDDLLELRGRFATERRAAELDATLTLLVDEVTPARWQAYLATLNKLLPKLSSSVSLAAVSPARLEVLSQKLKELDEQLRSGRIKPKTVNQARARARLLVLDEQLASNRLHGALRAQALVARGIQQDHLGRHEDARRDFDEALKLAPESAEALNASATNAQTRREFAAAREAATRALAQRPGDVQALHTRATSAYLTGDLAAARADWQSVLEQPAAVRRGFPLLLLGMTLRRSGEDPAALLARYPRDQWPTDWPRALLEFAQAPREGLSAAVDTLLKAARAERSAPEALCEAYYYIAERYAIEGDRERARDYWKLSVDTGVVEYVEHAASATRLAQGG